MSDPTRFVDDHPSELARSLLHAGLDEEPPPTLLKRTLAPLGIAATATFVSEAARAATTTAATGIATTAPPAVAVGSSLFVTTIKWVGIAGIGGGLVVGAASELAVNGERSSQAPAVRAPAKVAAGPAAAKKAPAEPDKVTEFPIPAPKETPPAPGATPVAKEMSPAPEASPARKETSPASEIAPMPAETSAAEATTTVFNARPPARTRSSADTEANKRSALLTEEAKVIDEARDAVATGDSARALRALAVHRRNFDKPLLRPEAMFLEMRALAARGDKAAATRVAEALLRRYPNGPQAAAARGFLRAQDP